MMTISRRSRTTATELKAALEALEYLNSSYQLAEELARGLSQRLGGADFKNTKLIEVNLGGADLRGANLSRAAATKANLNGADLRKARLTEADLKLVDLARADLREADLRDADLTGADLSGANLVGARLHGVLWSRLTSWPLAFDHIMRTNSTEIRTGVFRVDVGRGRKANDPRIGVR